MTDIHAEERFGKIHIYDRHGESGRIELTPEEAEFVKERIEEIL